MASWNELLDEFNTKALDARGPWLMGQGTTALQAVSALRSGSNVLFYASAFLQKPQTSQDQLQITYEDVNGFMSVIYGMDWTKPLTLLLHTPGGVTSAAETIVHYLRSKFAGIDVIVPTYAMSAGTMISLASEQIVMGRQSQLGPIDAHMVAGGRYISARAVVDQFDRAKSEILGDVKTAHAWAPILQSVGPSLLVEAQNALLYGEAMVERWLAQYMFAGTPNAKRRAKQAAKHFNDAGVHKSHGRRIDRDEARAHGVAVEDLEASQPLQDAVLTAYHIATIVFEQSTVTKLIWGSNDKRWLKNPTVPAPPAVPTP